MKIRSLFLFTAREALIKKGEDFAGRPQDMYLAEIYSRGYEDIGFSDYGAKWKLMRKITHGSMKMYGKGLEDLEHKVLLETKEVLKRLDAKCGKPIDPKNDISWSIIFHLSLCFKDLLFLSGCNFSS